MATTATPVVETPAQNPTEAPSAIATVVPPAQPAEVTTEKPAPELKSLLFDEESKAETTEAKPAPPAGAPEKYKFVPPEGKSYDPQVIEEFSAAAKAANLTQEAAQTLISTMAPALAARQQAQVNTIHQGWLEAVKTDKEYGGDKLQENLAFVHRFLKQFDPQPIDARGKELSTPLREFLKVTRLELQPDLLRVFVRAGKAISEDTFVSRSQGPGATVQLNDFASIANALYPPKG